MKYTKFLKFSYKNILKPIAFLFDAEFIHNIFSIFGKTLSKNKFTKNILKNVLCFEDESLHKKIFGLEFKNPIGLSAGFDYNAELVGITDAVGFGFESFGTVTYSAYDGNTKPRLGRLPKSKSLLVNKGFKNLGIGKVLDSIEERDNITQLIGISIGATNSPNCATPQAQIEDIIKSVKFLKIHPALKKISYVEINISCPNVLGSGSLAQPKTLTEVLNKINNIGINKPLFIKFPLEIEWENAKVLIQIMIEKKVSAVTIANLLKHRDEKYLNKDEIEKFKDKKGNFSGKPTFNLSNELIEKVYKEFGDRIKIIGVGGIFNAQDAYEKIKRGASLVQMITGMIYEGPQVIGEINKGLSQIMKKSAKKN